MTEDSIWFEGVEVPPYLTPDTWRTPRSEICALCREQHVISERCPCSRCICSLPYMEEYTRLTNGWYQQENRRKGLSKLPELKRHDVVKTAGNYYYYRGVMDFWKLVYTDGFVHTSENRVADIPSFTDTIIEVYRCHDDPNGFDQTDLINICFECADQYRLWRDRTVREMTMSELKEKLGYEVKIVEEHK